MLGLVAAFAQDLVQDTERVHAAPPFACVKHQTRRTLLCAADSEGGLSRCRLGSCDEHRFPARHTSWDHPPPARLCAKSYLFDTITHMPIWDRLVELAAEQHGYVTTRDARDIGVDPVQLRLLAARGRLERAGRGVYRVPVLPRGEHDDLAAAVSWTLGRGVISHESALALHALADVNPSRIHLTVPRDNHPRAAGGELYRLHRRDLQATDITSVDDIRVTTIARTIKDCMKTGTDPYQLRAAIERAEAEGTLRRAPAAELRAALDKPATQLRARPKRASA
jgi:predicted transcriptional regulator of viral defense system